MESKIQVKFFFKCDFIVIYYPLSPVQRSLLGKPRFEPDSEEQNMFLKNKVLVNLDIFAQKKKKVGDVGGIALL